MKSKNKTYFFVIFLIILLIAQTEGTEGETTTDIFTQIKNAIGGFFGFIYDSIVGGIKSFVDFVISISSFFSNFFNSLLEFFTNIAKSMWIIIQLIGKWGDPATHFKIQSTLVFYTTAVDEDIRNISTRAIQGDCNIRLSNLSFALLELKNDTRSVCDIIPSGFLGFISTSLWVAGGLQNIIMWFFKNFITIHALLFGGTIMLGTASSITKRSLDPLKSVIDLWSKYVGLYINLFNWILDKILRLAQIIAELIPL
ncbi:MAG: hypothetical protein QXZ63_07575 [Sulfolobales archaeon]